MKLLMDKGQRICFCPSEFYRKGAIGIIIKSIYTNATLMPE
jgi:succinyl-CoA synthetase alpha subunit